MNGNRYQKAVENICVPAGLEERVLSAARCREAERGGGSRGRLWFRPAARAAVCAVYALALVLGSVHLRPSAAPEVPSAEGGYGDRPAEGAPALPLSLSFGLTAYAAGTGDAYPAREDGAVAFAMGEGMANPGEGDFTGCLFQITGEDIASVSLSIDRGGLYRYRVLENLTEEEMARYRQIMGTPALATAAISRTDDGVWYMPEMVSLGDSVREEYDPEARYGFWVSPEEMAYNTGLSMTAEAQMDADYFDGASLTVTAVSESGAESTRVYRLHAGSLKAERTGDDVLTVLPEPAGEGDPCVYGIYALPET